MAPGADPRSAYDRIVQELVGEGAEAGKMFGMPCLKTGSKAFAGYFEGDMTFKLGGEAHERALALPGATLFDPSKRGRPMKEWVQVPADAAAEWPDLARSALQYVQGG